MYTYATVNARQLTPLFTEQWGISELFTGQKHLVYNGVINLLELLPLLMYVNSSHLKCGISESTLLQMDL